MIATHTHTGTFRRLALVHINTDGNGVFDDLDSKSETRITCPITPEFVLPYADRDIFFVKVKP